MRWAIVVRGQILEVCEYHPEAQDGEQVMPLEEAIEDGLPYT